MKDQHRSINAWSSPPTPITLEGRSSSRASLGVAEAVFRSAVAFCPPSASSVLPQVLIPKAFPKQYPASFRGCEPATYWASQLKDLGAFGLVPRAQDESQGTVSPALGSALLCVDFTL